MIRQYTCLFCGFEFICNKDVSITCSTNDHFFSLNINNSVVSSVYFVNRPNFIWISKLLTENKALYKYQILNKQEFDIFLDPEMHFDISEKYLKDNLNQDYIIKTIKKLNKLALFL